ncbi:MAG: response regulator [Patescibacteria group bacterium]
MSYKLLIVDDSRGCCELYKMRFELDRWQVEVAFSAEKAIEILKDDKYKPDAMLLDIMLPKMQGDEFLKIIKSDPKTKDIKVVVLTALNFFKGEEEKLSNKADDYILKIEIMPDQLVKRVTELVEGKHSAREEKKTD